MIMRMILNNILTNNTNNSSKKTNNNNIHEVWPPECRNVFQAISKIAANEQVKKSCVIRSFLLRTA